jgi:hypothetical protein
VADIAHPNAAAVQSFRRSTLVSYRNGSSARVLCAFGRLFDPRPALRARSEWFGEVTIGRILARAHARGEPVALGRVDASVFDPSSALRAKEETVWRGAEELR